LALVDMTVVEQRYWAVLAVEQGEPRYQVAAQFGVSRQTLHKWITRYRADGPVGLASRSHRPGSPLSGTRGGGPRCELVALGEEIRARLDDVLWNRVKLARIQLHHVLILDVVRLVDELLQRDVARRKIGI